MTLKPSIPAITLPKVSQSLALAGIFKPKDMAPIVKIATIFFMTPLLFLP
jgi:hypothetical protein